MSGQEAWPEFSFEVIGTEFERIVREVERSAARDGGGRPALELLRLEAGEDKLTAVAVDGFRLASSEAKAIHEPGVAISALFERIPLVSFSRLCKHYAAVQVQTAGRSANNQFERWHFQAGPYSYSAVCQNEFAWPAAIDEYLEQGPGAFLFMFDPEYLRQAMATVSRTREARAATHVEVGVAQPGTGDKGVIFSWVQDGLRTTHYVMPRVTDEGKVPERDNPLKRQQGWTKA